MTTSAARRICAHLRTGLFLWGRIPLPYIIIYTKIFSTSAAAFRFFQGHFVLYYQQKR